MAALIMAAAIELAAADPGRGGAQAETGAVQAAAGSSFIAKV
jgi:hypothetical protein